MIDINEANWDLDLRAVEKKQNGDIAKALAFVIDSDVVETIVVDEEVADKLLAATSFSEAVFPPANLAFDPETMVWSEEYIVYHYVAANFGETSENVKLHESLAAILLSNPEIYDISTDEVYPEANRVGVGCSFIDGDFVIPEVYQL
jgi:hypothetical protein